MDKVFQPDKIEKKWLEYWKEKHAFDSKVDTTKKPYTIVLPPPNVTGVLHMGHMLNVTLQDVLIRRARSKGYNACWIPGTDHASIATEAKVTSHLKTQGIEKNDLSKEEFVTYAWEWTKKHGGIILDQLKRVGASCDWSRTKFTLDEDMSRSVHKVFIDLYQKGLIYKGHKMVNWDPEAQTTLSDEEVLHTPENSTLYFIKYALFQKKDEYITIATTRPETIFADSALCVHPDDHRYKGLIGKKVIIPLTDRKISVIADEYVTPEFGTGCLKITPAHDFNDYEIGKRHHLPSINILNTNGTLNQNGLHYKGKDRFVVRKEIAQELQEKGFLVKKENHLNQVGRSERSDSVVEPRLSVQWFLKVSDLAKKAWEAIESGEMEIIPNKFTTTYRNWIENIKDWNISRQLYWGHEIPAYYHPSHPDKFVVADSKEAAAKTASQLWQKEITPESLIPEKDVLDTWFSSWLWPISVFDGINDTKNPVFQYYYPTEVLVTAPEILFFWVIRMVMFGKYHTGVAPFKKVYLTGIVRDAQRRKMSKSLGNSPDPVALIEKYGADAVRVGMLLTSPAGNDLLFDEKLCLQGRNFANKIWNALRLLKSWKVENETPSLKRQQYCIEWFEEKCAVSLECIENHFEKFRLSEALKVIYTLVWGDFCSWYLEGVKPEYGQSVSSKVAEKSLSFFHNLIEVLHPFMPFITEEIRQEIQSSSINTSNIGLKITSDIKHLSKFEHIQKLISEIRNTRKKNQLTNKSISLLHGNKENFADQGCRDFIHKMAQTQVVFETPSQEEAQERLMVDAKEYFLFIPGTREKVDISTLKKELEHYRKFAESLDKKLNNEKFRSKAPKEIIQREEKKRNDTYTKIQILEKKLHDSS